MTIGERIKIRRSEIGLTQQDLADKLGVTKSAICRVERGFEKNLTTDRVKKFADALNCGVGKLMGWEDANFEETFHEDSLKIEYEIREIIKNFDDEQLNNLLQYARFLQK